MRRCLDLAQNGRGFVAPNPMVGSVIVADDRIIGEAWHHAFGGAHAEVEALSVVRSEDLSLLKIATLYVNLEPCVHQGNTPPCADRIIREGIPRVVIANTDPDPRVAAKGIDRLRQAGIEVTTGILEKNGIELNRHFFTFHQLKRPYITLKWAQTADGFISRSGEKTAISGEVALRYTHQLRASHAAILVGTNTALTDDPSLTVRFAEGSQPVRLLIDRELRVPLHFRLFSGEGKIIVFNALKSGEEGNISYVQLPFDPTLPTKIMQHLYAMKIQSVLVEGGAFTLQQFIDAGLWDEAFVYRSTIVLVEGVKAPALPCIPCGNASRLGPDLLFTYRRNQ